MLRARSPRAACLPWLSRLGGLLVFAAAGCGGDGWSPQGAAESARHRLNHTRDGGRILDAIQAHGGLEAWYAAPTSSYSFEYSSFSANLRFETYMVVDNRSRRVYHDLRTIGTPDSVETVDARFAWDGELAWISPADRRQPNPRFWALTGFYFTSIPFVLADRGIRFHLLPTQDLDGKPHDRVMAYFEPGVGTTPGDVYVLYLDPETDMVSAVLYTVSYGQPYEPRAEAPSPPRNGTLLHYEEYITVDGLTVPTRFRGFEYRNGEPRAQRNEAWVSEISFRRPFDASRVQMPRDARIEPYSAN